MDRLIDGAAVTALGLALLAGRETTAAPWWQALADAGVVPHLTGVVLLAGGTVLVAAWVALRALPPSHRPALAGARRAAAVVVALVVLLLTASVVSWAAVHGWQGAVTAILLGSLSCRLLVVAGRALP